jgi:HSP20 family protein
MSGHDLGLCPIWNPPDYLRMSEVRRARKEVRTMSDTKKSLAKKTDSKKAKGGNGHGDALSTEVLPSRPMLSWRYPFFGDWFDRFPRFMTPFPDLWAQVTDEGMPVEEFVDDGELVIRAELPGVDVDDDIEVEVDDGRLSIRARREQREETKEEGSFRSEFHYGSFRRTMTLPKGTEADDVKASYRDGILEVRVPFTVETEEEEAERTKVPISRT